MLSVVCRCLGIASLATGLALLVFPDPVARVVRQPVENVLLTTMDMDRYAAGVATAGAGGRRHLSWGELTALEFEERYLATVKAGVPVPRKLQRVLVLKGQAASLTVHEPYTAAGKARVVDALAAAAPEVWRDRIRSVGAGW